MKKEYLFSYGTLQKGVVQLRLFGRLLAGTKDILEGFKAADVVIADVVFLAKEESRQSTATVSPGDVIHGTAFEISFEELVMVDRYEPNNYERIRVTLRSGRQAWMYLKVE